MTAQAHADATGTELAAQRKASRFAGTLRGKVLAVAAERGDNGVTVLEAVEALGIDECRRYSIAPRLPELVRLGYLTKTSNSRADCAVCVATGAGIAWAAGVAA